MPTTHRAVVGRIVGRVAVVTLVLLVVLAATPTVTATTTPATTERPRLAVVYPNPLADGDAGEFVVVATPRATNVTLTDGESTVDVRVPTGRTALSAEPLATRALTEHPVVAAPKLGLANGASD